MGYIIHVVTKGWLDIMFLNDYHMYMVHIDTVVAAWLAILLPPRFDPRYLIGFFMLFDFDVIEPIG